ncbi:lipoprotein releasing system ATP-binding protein LolD [Thermogladius calderae 1633]|uniref:Molybdate/tungstate import ATP-binding protein WtpC n=1 Tax=Thermogladius calderae (strain DSM 22663 / VKM B-2946 / 1633) TaxID=1184251 RepID=I3TDN3_THEC1|nr:ATP-binding cassette domain-containing protein [Thermogladius calderae]AFK50871.1 lipoprotein releasing system ATP-binding protein LolD [Thermogladius calderae 1633]
MELVKLEKVRKTINGRVVLENVDLQVGPSRIVVVRGRSGAGKTTLLKLMVLLLKPDEGRVLINGVDAWRLGTAARSRLVSGTISYIPQTIDLLPNLTVKENIELPVIIKGLKRRDRELAVREVSELLGIPHMLERRVETLSGGEKQVVALARSLVTKPRLVVADEPFAYVDDKGVEKLFNTIRELRDRLGVSFVITTTEINIKSFTGDEEYLLTNGTLTKV